MYYSPITDAHRLELDKVFGTITGADLELDRKIEVWGRQLVIPESGNGAARFSFTELCGNPLSAADYIELTKEFGTIFVQDIPHLSLSSKDKARRFITFIDGEFRSTLDETTMLKLSYEACYESKTKLFTLSEIPIFEIFSDENAGNEVTDHMRHVMDDLVSFPDDVATMSSPVSNQCSVTLFSRVCQVTSLAPVLYLQEMRRSSRLLGRAQD